MKTFEDLEFKDETPDGKLKQAVCFFGNGYGISVITATIPHAFIDERHPFASALLDPAGRYVRNTDRPFQNQEAVTAFMKEIQEMTI